MNPFLPTCGIAVRTLALACLLLLGHAFAVPAVIAGKFREKYGDPGPVSWEVDKNGYWEAQFQADGRDYRADFLSSGEWVETESNVEFDDLPDKLRQTIRSEHGDREIAEIEEVESAAKGHFFDVEFERPGRNQDFEYLPDGQRVPVFLGAMRNPMEGLEGSSPELRAMSPLDLIIEFGMNLVTIFIYAVGIYYLRHHDHKMLFLLLAFNLFLFPVFLLSSMLTVGFAFTIFAMLGLVRLRSARFDKAEIAYLIGAVALTFINSQLKASVEIVASALVLATAFIADHPLLWRSACQTTKLRYRISDTDKMLDRRYLIRQVAEDFDIEVNDIEIDEIRRKEVRMTVMYKAGSENGRPPWSGWIKTGKHKRKEKEKNDK